jgi:large subunit ribosomal protein L23
MAAEISEAKKVKSTKKAESKKAETVAAVDNSEITRKVLLEPWITEKTHAAIADNKYTFKVSRSATKKQVKLAVESLYGVRVEKITSVTLLPKTKAYGRYQGIKSGIRKMTVTLKAGDKIELFKGA